MRPGVWTAVSWTVAWMIAGCGGGAETPPAAVTAPVVEQKALEGPLPALLVTHAQFRTGADGKPAPGPAKLVIWRTDGERWQEEVIEDEGSNVFHKAVAWRDGILTIAAGQVGFDPPKPAQLRYWVRGEDGWTPTTLWEQTWSGRFQRLRDFEIGDLNGDGKEEIAIATHDMGVVAVGSEDDEGNWVFVEMDETPDTFVHEIEIGDVDGDGKLEFYATPSDRNKASGESQPGGVVRYDFNGTDYTRSPVVSWENTHAKEILVADLTGEGDALYVAREGHVVRKGGQTELLDPVKILRMDRQADGSWAEVVVAELDDHQTRFLVPGDVDHDGKMDLLAAGYKSGLWLLKLKDDGTFEPTLIDGRSSGFEHATHVADLDGDGKLEIYVASDDQKELRRYLWNGERFERTTIARLPERHITWNIQDGRL